MTFLERFSPLVKSLRGYDKDALRGDVTAGLTTAVMLIPQGMAYAMLAGLPPIVGLYSSVVPPLLYSLLGTSRQLSVGPVAMDSLLVAAAVGSIAESGTDAYLVAAMLLALMVGLIQLLMGLLRLGFLVNFLSHPVVSGFTSAAALIIGLSQLEHLLGIRVAGAENVMTLTSQIIENAATVQPETFGLGLLAILALVSLKKLAPRAPAALIVVVLGALVVGLAGWKGKVAIVGTVPTGLPSLVAPAADWALVRALLPSAVTIALVAFMESISVSKAYARKNKYAVLPNRELLALGAANMAGGLFQGYPVTGGFSRTAVNAEAGARTNVAALITTAVVALSLLFLTPLFYFLPRAVLAAIIVTAVLGLVDLGEVRHLRRVKKADLVLLSITFVSTLSLGIIEGIGVGVGASVLWFVLEASRPHIAVLGRVPGTTHFKNIERHSGLITYPGVIALRMDAQFYFGNIAFLKDTLAELEARMKEPLRAVVLDASAINALDSSAETALREISEELGSRGIAFYMTGVKGPVRDVLDSSGLSEVLGFSCKCLNVHEALTMLNVEGAERVHPAPGSPASLVEPMRSAHL